MPSVFGIPQVENNEDGWGPLSVPGHLAGIPYAPFQKNDKIGRISDFTQSGLKYGSRYGQQQSDLAVLNYFHNDEEESFHLVDNKPDKRNKGPRRFQPNRFQQQKQREQERREQEKDMRGQRKQQRKQQQQFQNYREPQRQQIYSSSVDIRPEWVVKEQIQFTSLLKLNYKVSEPEEIKFCGKLQYYDKSYDRVTPRLEKSLQRTRKLFRNVTTSDDPVIRDLAKKGVGKVFATDSLITALMCATRSVYSWDIIVERQGDFLFFDKRDGSSLDQLTVSETAPESVPEERESINGVQQLSREATSINQSFSQQVLQRDGPGYDCGEPTPFPAEGKEQIASTAYRYRKWSIADDVDLVVRCELDGVMNYKGEEQLLLIKALNEFDSKNSGVDWRQKLETQRGAVLANELKNNANKLAKWTAAAHLSGSDMIKLGYIARTTPRDNTSHTILGTQVCKPKDFAQQINLNMDNCWGIVRALVDLCLKLDEGKYLLLKDPNKPLLRLYEVPGDAFETHYSEEPVQQEEEVVAEDDTAENKDEDDENE